MTGRVMPTVVRAADLGTMKQAPEDFLVREVQTPSTVSAEVATHRYLELRKSGLTTTEAVQRLAAMLSIPESSVTYSGRKDEDGITEQLVAVPIDSRVDELESTAQPSAGSWIAVRHHSYGENPLRVGELDGNSFVVVIRNLPPEVAADLADAKRINLFFLNYYDTQRFGVPGGPKRTHLVGRALLEGDHDTALAEVAGLMSAESSAAREWAGPSSAFFDSLDDRIVAFYFSAAESAAWNESLADVVLDQARGSATELEVDALRYVCTTRQETVLAVLAALPELDYRRYSFMRGRVATTPIRRPTVVQTLVSVRRDALPEGCARLSFFLPSGCYATMAIRQLLLLGAAP
jgi:tRNA pseudouridine13 synthase